MRMTRDTSRLDGVSRVAGVKSGSGSGLEEEQVGVGGQYRCWKGVQHHRQTESGCTCAGGAGCSQCRSRLTVPGVDDKGRCGGGGEWGFLRVEV